MKHYVVSILCLSLATCSVTQVPIPIPGGKRPPRLASEIVNNEATQPRDGAGAIVVKRDKTRFWHKHCTYDIALDNRLVAGLRNGEQLTFYADPGPRSLAISIRPEKHCEAATALVPVNVVASTTTSIRIAADVEYDLKVEATTY